MRELCSLLTATGARLGLAVTLGVLAACSGSGLLALAAYLLSRAALHPTTFLLLLVPVVGVRCLSLLRALARYLQALTVHDTALAVQAQVQERVFSALAVRPALLLQDAGAWLERLTVGVEHVQRLVVEGVVPALALVGFACLVAAGLGHLGHGLAGTVAAGLAACGLGIPFLSWLWQRRVHGRLGEQEAALARGLVAVVEGMADLLLTPASGEVRAGLVAAGERASQLRLALDSAAGWARASALLAAAMTSLAVLWQAEEAVGQGDLPRLALPALTLAALAACEAAVPMAQAAPGLAEAAANAERLLCTTAEVRPAPARLAKPQGFSLTARSLSAGHREGRAPLLDAVDLHLAEGRHVFLLGPSGAGKSTLLQVLAGLRADYEGEVRLGGADLRHVPRTVLSRTLVLVPHEPHLFNATLEENLRVARPEASAADLQTALAVACLDAWAAKLARGLATEVGEGGRLLSGGERQRLGLARAVLTDARVLLLDEPFTSLGPELAAEVAGNLARHCRGRSVLLVTHAPVPGWAADELWHLLDGRLTRVCP